MGGRIFNGKVIFGTGAAFIFGFFIFAFSICCEAQTSFSRLDEWMNTNTKNMGGRTIDRHERYFAMKKILDDSISSN